MGRNTLARRTAAPRQIVPWLFEMATTLPSLARSYAPGAPLNPRTREAIMLAVADVNGSRCCAWVHGSWRDFLGEGVHDDVEHALLTYARASAEAGKPSSVDELSALLPSGALRGLRATVARIELAGFVEQAADGLVARLRGRRSWSPLATARDAVTVASALPFAVPMFATAAAMRLASRAAPATPAIETPDDDANLLVHMLATAARAYLSHTLVRLALLALPRPIAIGVRSGRSAATVHVGGGVVLIENGIDRDTVLVLEGEIESLLQTATGSIMREVSTIRIRPS